MNERATTLHYIPNGQQRNLPAGLRTSPTSDMLQSTISAQIASWKRVGNRQPSPTIQNLRHGMMQDLQLSPECTSRYTHVWVSPKKVPNTHLVSWEDGKSYQQRHVATIRIPAFQPRGHSAFTGAYLPSTAQPPTLS